MVNSDHAGCNNCACACAVLFTKHTTDRQTDKVIVLSDFFPLSLLFLFFCTFPLGTNTADSLLKKITLNKLQMNESNFNLAKPTWSLSVTSDQRHKVLNMQPFKWFACRSTWRDASGLLTFADDKVKHYSMVQYLNC